MARGGEIKEEAVLPRYYSFVLKIFKVITTIPSGPRDKKALLQM